MLKGRIFTIMLTTLISLVSMPALSVTVSAGDSVFDIGRLRDENILLININTNDSIEPTYDEIAAPDGLWGAGITNATKVPGRMTIMLGDSTLYDSGDYINKVSGMTVKVRGNTSAYYQKKPYKIKLQKKCDLLFRGDTLRHSEKNWVLIYSGALSTRTVIGYWMNELVGMQWTPGFRYANVVMNGIYRGLYLLVESVERNANGRIDVDKQSGYILEYDPYWWKEDLYMESSYSEYMNYTFKYPDTDIIPYDKMEYITGATAAMEASLYDGTYPEHIDVRSFASWLLAHDILGTWDSGGSNIFITKYDSTAATKFTMGNLWDFDMIESMEGTWARVHEDRNAFFYPVLLSSSNKAFTQAYIDRWHEVGNTVIDSIMERLDRMKSSSLLRSINHYYPLDYIVSSWNHIPLEDEIEEHKRWFVARKKWMSEAISAMTESAIIPPVADRKDNTLYNLHGQKVDANYRGIVICNGRKYIKR